MCERSVVRYHEIGTLEKEVVEEKTRTDHINDVGFVKKLTTNLLYVSCIRKRNMEGSLKSDQQNKDRGLVLVTDKRSRQLVMNGFAGS